MTCDQALESLLHVELNDLATDGASPLSEHMRGCGRCRRVAGQVLNDTRLLASAFAVSTVRARPKRRRTLVFVPLVATAVAAALVMVTSRSYVDDAVTTVNRLSPVTVVAPKAATEPNASPVVRRVARSTSPRLGRAFPAAVPVTPVRIELARDRTPDLAPPVSGTVSVTPPSGTRAAVMQTSDPKLVVVWLYGAPEDYR